jgi:hypothetical protein
MEPSHCNNETKTDSETINGLHAYRHKIEGSPEIMLVISAYATEQQKRPKRRRLDAGDDDGYYNFAS